MRRVCDGGSPEGPETRAHLPHHRLLDQDRGFPGKFLLPTDKAAHTKPCHTMMDETSVGNKEYCIVAYFDVLKKIIDCMRNGCPNDT